MGRLKIDPFTDEVSFTPANVNRELMKSLFIGMSERTKFHGKQLIQDAGWKFFVVNQTRGRCYFRRKVITIPAWVVSTKGVDYKEWYITHEMAHAYQWLDDKYCDSHGPKFMTMLMSLCPPESVHYELGYKPRNAAAAGITKPEDDDEFDFN